MTRVTDRSFTSAGLTIAGVEWSGEIPTIALHGWLDNCSSFDPVLPFCPRLNCLAIDLAGHGLSGHRGPGCHDYTFVEYVADVVFVVNQMNWKKFNLLGHSMGAAISLLFAGICPDRVEKIFLIDGFAPLSAQESDFLLRCQKFIAESTAPASKLREFASLEEAGNARTRVGNLSQNAAELLAKRSTKLTKNNGFEWRSDARLKQTSPQRLTPGQVDVVLKNISCPVHLLRATHPGFEIDESLNTKFSESLTQFTMETMEGGHHLHMDQPELVANKINNFFSL